MREHWTVTIFFCTQGSESCVLEVWRKYGDAFPPVPRVTVLSQVKHANWHTLIIRRLNQTEAQILSWTNTHPGYIWASTCGFRCSGVLAGSPTQTFLLAWFLACLMQGFWVSSGLSPPLPPQTFSWHTLHYLSPPPHNPAVQLLPSTKLTLVTRRD